MTVLLGIDLETTGLIPEEGNIIEIGAILWDVSANETLISFSCLVQNSGEITLPGEITAMTGITQRMIDQHGVPLDMALKKLGMLSANADYVVAHNRQFETDWLELAGMRFTLPWIDTKCDLPFLPGKGKGSLSEIAMSHGLFNPRPHRALPDVFVMMQLLSKYDFLEVERYALTPALTLIISFPYDVTGEKNKLVKELGYYWQAEAKNWSKPTKAFNAVTEIEQAAKAGFTARVVEKE